MIDFTHEKKEINIVNLLETQLEIEPNEEPIVEQEEEEVEDDQQDKENEIKVFFIRNNLTQVNLKIGKK